jgi:menaquinone-dependent protoporphyrinogen oxidase
MKALVAAASRHGATLEIACAIAAALEAKQIEAAVLRVDEVSSLAGYDAVVLGSAVYMGRWLEGAKNFIDEHIDELTTRPVWLFSSGPIGDPPKPEMEPDDVAPLVQRTRARGHRLFGGRLAKRDLGLGEKVVVSAIRAREGDFRRWHEIDTWADAIAHTLRIEAQTPAPRF